MRTVKKEKSKNEKRKYARYKKCKTKCRKRKARFLLTFQAAFPNVPVQSSDQPSDRLRLLDSGSPASSCWLRNAVSPIELPDDATASRPDTAKREATAWTTSANDDWEKASEAATAWELWTWMPGGIR